MKSERRGPGVRCEVLFQNVELLSKQRVLIDGCLHTHLTISASQVADTRSSRGTQLRCHFNRFQRAGNGVGHCFGLTIDDDLGQLEQLWYFLVTGLAVRTLAHILITNVRHVGAICPPEQVL